MDEYTDEPYYSAQNAYSYPPIPSENTETFALNSEYLEYPSQNYHHERPDRPDEYDFPAAVQYYPINEFEQHARVSNDHFYATTPQEDDVEIKEEVGEETVHFGPFAEEEEQVEDEEVNDEVDEPAPAPAFPAAVAPHELKYSTKKMRDKNMSIFHRKEFAYCEVAMTIEEHFVIKGLNHVAPQTFSLPDKNGKYQKRKRIRITWAERDALNAWRTAHGVKPHELRPGSKYAAARDYWRLQPPHVVKPRKTIEWNKARGPVPAA
ncbi:hypothetical protein NHQ30_001388 [Ciborinia camelliae]|nr:hypothetical protein NHQ30_001388 [Ciborinia camelliae]